MRINPFCVLKRVWVCANVIVLVYVCAATMDQNIPYDDYQLPVVFLPSYENPPAWIPPQEASYKR